MPSIEITRRRIDLTNGQQKTFRVFYVNHSNGYVMRKSFELWKSHGLMEGGDYYKHVNSKGVIKQYRICIVCGLSPQDPNKDLCAQCRKDHEEKQKNKLSKYALLKQELETASVSNISLDAAAGKNLKFYKFNAGEALPLHVQRLVNAGKRD